MVTETNNPPAFPRSYTEMNSSQQGMSLRDYFAAKALAAFIVNEGPVQKWGAEYSSVTHESGYASDAERAYRYADAMLAEREK